METKQTNLGITYGLIGGLALSVVLLLLYLGGVETFMSPFAWSGYVIIIVLAVLAGIKQRKLNGGHLEFSQALKTTFAVFAIGFLIQTIFNYVLMNFIDPSFRDALIQKTMEKMEELLRRFGTPEDDIDKALTEGAKSDTYALKNVLLGYAISCFVFFIISLIISAIIKRSRTSFDNTFTQENINQ